MTSLSCFGIAGWKNSGKTTLVSSLVSEITASGLRVSTLKHAHHAFDLDQSGTDSFRHRDAGAMQTVLVSENRWAIQHELRGAPEPTFNQMLEKMENCDLVLVEGYKREPIPKIEILAPGSTEQFLWETDKNVRAVASDEHIESCSLPQFKREQISEIANFILKFHGITP